MSKKTNTAKPKAAKRKPAKRKPAKRNLNKEETGLLLFFETCAVDREGLVAPEKMNADDHKIAERWRSESFIEFGRVASTNGLIPRYSIWVHLSTEAWKIAHAERRRRADRMWANRSWLTTVEKQHGDAEVRA